MLGSVCACCGKAFHGSPSIGYAKPPYYFLVPESEREDRIKIDSDLCLIRARHDQPDEEDIFAIRCVLEVPIHGAPEPFTWGVWVSQSHDSFWRYVETYNDDQTGDRSFGWLTVVIPHYSQMQDGEAPESLACDVIWGAPGGRPKVILQACDHPLYRDQINGIDWDTAIKIAGPNWKDCSAS